MVVGVFTQFTRTKADCIVRGKLQGENTVRTKLKIKTILFDFIYVSIMELVERDM